MARQSRTWTYSKLLETARFKVVEAAKADSIELKQTYDKEAQQLSYRAVRYAHPRQFKRMRKVIKRQRTIVAGCGASGTAS